MEKIRRGREREVEMKASGDVEAEVTEIYLVYLWFFHG